MNNFNFKVFRIVFTVLVFGFLQSNSNAQILHTESFSVILDSTKNIKGNILPDFKFQNLKENFIEFENTSDISFLVNNNAITLANKFVLSKFGDENILSGGYLYIEFRKISELNFVFEPYSQIQWSEARGIKFKYAGGSNLRYRIMHQSNIGIYAGIGAFYEYEKWGYSGVKDVLLPANQESIETNAIKFNSYGSFKWDTGKKIILDFSLYYQSHFKNFGVNPRLASSSRIKYSFTEHLGLNLTYQNVYDYAPVVPIDKLFNKVIFTIEVSF